MKRKDLLLLTFLLSQTTSIWAMDESDRPERSATSARHSNSQDDRSLIEKAYQLKESLLKVDREIEAIPSELLNGEKVFLLGKTGSGKSTLMNFLIGNPLFVGLDNDDEIILNTSSPLEGSEIGHEGSTTSLPSLCKINNIVLCDFPGFGDTRGEEEDIINAYRTYKLFSGNFKILLAVEEEELFSVGRGTGLLKTMGYLTKILPVDQLKGSLALVVTKQGKRSNPRRKLINLIQNSSGDVKELLLHLTEEEHISSRVPFFPCPGPNTVGDYDFPESREEILESINLLSSVSNHKIQPLQLSNDSREVINKLILPLGKQVTEYLGNTVSQKIMTFCSKVLEKGIGEEKKIEELTEGLEVINKALYDLTHSAKTDMKNFAGFFNEFFEHPHENILIKPMEDFNFFRTIKQDIKYPIGDWNDALGSSLILIQSLIDHQETFLVEEEKRVAAEEAARVEREEGERKLAEQYQAHLATLERLQEEERQAAAERERQYRERIAQISTQQPLAPVRAPNWISEVEYQRLKKLKQPVYVRVFSGGRNHYIGRDPNK